eukprot:5323022-Pyramimonas_sp.AAC.1
MSVLMYVRLFGVRRVLPLRRGCRSQAPWACQLGSVGRPCGCPVGGVSAASRGPGQSILGPAPGRLRGPSLGGG